MIIRLNSHAFFQLIFFILILNFLMACGEVSPNIIEINQPIIVKEIEKIPLRAGLYLNQYFRDFRKGSIFLGYSFTKAAEEIANKAFEEVVAIDTRDPDLIPKNIEAIVIPEIEKVYGVNPAEDPNRFGHYGTILVRIKWSIFDMKGRILYMNTFESEAKVRKTFSTPKGFDTRLCEAYTQAIKDNFEKAFISISSTNWWKPRKEKTN